MTRAALTSKGGYYLRKEGRGAALAIGALAIAISFKACYAVEFLNVQLINTLRTRKRTKNH